MRRAYYKEFPQIARMNKQTVASLYTDLNKLPTLHKKIFQQHQNTMGEYMGKEFLNFLQK